MAIARLAAVSEYLLRLYARSSEADASAYSTFALDGMRELLGADRAWWGVMSASKAGPRLLSSFRSELPASWEAAWESIKHDDSLAKSIAETKNRTVTLDSDSLPSTSGLLLLADGFDLRETLSVSVDLPDQDAFMFVSLYRGRGQRRYTPEDKSINQMLMPHLHAAWRHNLRQRLRAHGEREGADIYNAFVDREGKLVQHEDGFADLIGRHWHSWRGSVLPLRLRETVERAREAPGNWIGQGSCKVRAAPAGLLTLVQLRAITALDRLTPREFEVAGLFAEGSTHKEIARLTALTPSTVRHYLREAYAKLDIDNKAALAGLFSRNGLAPRRDSSSNRTAEPEGTF